MLIDQYLGVYGDPSPRVPNGVVPKNDQYLRVYGDHLSPPHKIGETVEALYCNGQWYTAQIKSRVEGSPDTFEVAWSDGDSNDTIKHKSNIRRPNSGMPLPINPQAGRPPKFCHVCGKQQVADARFCANCGTPIPAQLPP
jgi:hypothetical protein